MKKSQLDVLGKKVEDETQASANTHGRIGGTFRALIAELALPWDKDWSYSINELVLSRGRIFECIKEHQNKDPSLKINTTYWKSFFARSVEDITKDGEDLLISTQLLTQYFDKRVNEIRPGSQNDFDATLAIGSKTNRVPQFGPNGIESTQWPRNATPELLAGLLKGANGNERVVGVTISQLKVLLGLTNTTDPVNPVDETKPLPNYRILRVMKLVTDPATVKPSKPINLQIIDDSSGWHRLKYTDTSDNEAGFYIYVAEGLKGDFARKFNVGANETLSGLLVEFDKDRSKDWRFYVTSYNSAGESDPSNIVTLASPNQLQKPVAPKVEDVSVSIGESVNITFPEFIYDDLPSLVRSMFPLPAGLSFDKETRTVYGKTTTIQTVTTTYQAQAANSNDVASVQFKFSVKEKVNEIKSVRATVIISRPNLDRSGFFFEIVSTLGGNVAYQRTDATGNAIGSVVTGSMQPADLITGKGVSFAETIPYDAGNTPVSRFYFYTWAVDSPSKKKYYEIAYGGGIEYNWTELTEKVS